MDLLKAYESRTRVDGFNVDDTPSAFTETVAAAFALVRREELIDSSLRAFRAGNSKRADTIGKLGGDVQTARNYDLFIGPAQRQRFRAAMLRGELENDPTWRTLIPQARRAFLQVTEFERRYPDQVPNDDQIWDDFKKESAQLRGQENYTLERGGGFAAFLGTAGAVMTDPLILATLPFGAEIAAGRSALATVARTASIEASIGIAIEIPIQAEVVRFKREIESPWSFRQSAINVLAAGGGAFAIGGTIAGGVVGTRSLLKRYKAAKDAGDITVTPEMEEAERILDGTLDLHDENPLRVTVDDEVFPLDTPHERAFEDARAQHTDNRPVDVRDTVEGIEPDDGLNQVLTRSENQSELVSIDPRELQIDAKQFQFKSGSDGAGVNDALRDVKVFDQRLAGVALIWERADGVQFIVDGHQRVALGKRAIAAGQAPEEVRLNGFILREADGITAIDARRMAAVKNMAEGSGSALDAAKILRDVGPMGEAMLPPLPPRSALVRQAKGLANLGEDEFLAVVNGVIDERFGALVGAATSDTKLQQAMIGVLRRTKPANEVQARSIVDQVRTAGTETKVTEDLFGATQVTESLYLERAQVLDAALKESRKDKAVFGRLLSEADRIQEAGTNRLDKDANLKRMQEATDATTQISRLANTKGPISEALTEAARQVKAGKKPGEVAASFLETIRREILAGDSGGEQAGRTRPGRDKAGDQPVETPLDPEGIPTNPVDTGLDPVGKAEALHVLGAENDALVKPVLAAIDAELNTTSQTSFKKIETIVAKAERAGVLAKRPFFQVEHIRDSYRFKTVIEPTTDLAAIGKAIDKLFEDIPGTRMIKAEPEMLFAPKAWGWRAAVFDLQMPNGQLVEWYMPIRELETAKKSRGHLLFERWRDEDITALTPERAKAFNADLAESNQLYGDAWEAALKRMNQDETAARAAFDSALASSPASVVKDSASTSPVRGVLPELDQTSFSRTATKPSEPVTRTVPDSSIETKSAIGRTSDESITDDPFLTQAEGDIRTDLLGDDTRAAQGTADEIARRDAARSSGQESIETGDPGDLFSQARNQVDFVDAAPRPIVRAVDDVRSPQPDANRTGTVPDSEYEAVLAQANELIENRGAFAQVGREVNGELETRSLASEIESLDALEDTLERIRICSFKPRRAA